MSISELILLLQEAQEKHGDLEVGHRKIDEHGVSIFRVKPPELHEGVLADYIII